MKKQKNTRFIAVTGILSAISAILMMLEFSLPFLPSFLKLDFSDLPALIGSFSLGPLCGALCCLIKNIFHLFFTTTGGVGELCNFILSASFVIPAGIIYKKYHSFRGAVLSCLSSSFVMALISYPVNLFITYPVYIRLFMPQETILDLYRAFLPEITGLAQAILIFNTPFTFCKGLLICIITVLIYKKLSPVLKGSKK